jgi:peptidyl-prolyl cis-trans isomerase C
MRISTIRGAAPKAISVNGAVIAAADIAREVQNHPGGSPDQAWEEAARALVIRTLLSQRARDLNLAAEPRAVGGLRETGEEALIRVLLETEVRTPVADEATCRRYYQANLSRFRGPDLFEPLHILFQASRGDVAAYSTAVARAESVLDKLKTRPSDFESLARAMSDCPSASEGGRLGQVVRGGTTPEFEAALVTAHPGAIHPTPVLTRYGVHVLRLDRKVTGETLPFETVRTRIAHYLEDRTWRRAVAQYISLLAGGARIEGFDLPGAASPLVQ